MPKTPKTPTSVLIALMDQYQLNPFSLSKKIKLSASAVRLLVIGESKITVPTALRLGKFFGKPPAFWLDLQREADLFEAGRDKKLATILKGISKVEKPRAVPKTKAKKKPLKKVTLRDKRKKAAKVPGAKPAARSPKAKAKRKTR